MQQIRYLKQDEKNRTRKMYETNFPEDSQAFVDYYYKHKTRDNQILVLENTPELQVMLHLNPYTFSIYGKKVELNYIVAVATDISVRRQGKMTEVMAYALCDMARKQQPFTFLIPANPKVYISKGFTFVKTEDYQEIHSQLEKLQEWGLPECKLWAAEILQGQELQAAEVMTEVMADLHVREANQSDSSLLAEFSNLFLQENYHVFPGRTEEFYIRKLEELKSENGGIALLFDKKRLVGMFSYGKEAARVELQEILVREEYKKHLCEVFQIYLKEDNLENMQIAITTMPYMVRILDLKTLISLLHSKEAFSLKVQVEDFMIPQNEGCYEIHIDKMGGRLTPIAKEEDIPIMDISELTKEIFRHIKLFIREWV